MLSLSPKISLEEIATAFSDFGETSPSLEETGAPL